ncbi:MAG: hypothetical protein K5869_03880 [Saccharofermentans sp.]|nr:hypothetical protein [Saccharofermentans sp.]
MNSIKTLSRKVVFIIVAALLSCLVFTACGHKLSGKYKGEDGSVIEFTSDENCKMYSSSSSGFVEGTYHWADDDKCYYLEFSNYWTGGIRVKATVDGNKLTVQYSGMEQVLTKE